MSEVDLPACFGHTIFCDDIRQEVGGKISMMGVYHPDIILGEIPGLIATFAMLVTFVQKPEVAGEPLELRIYMPGEPDDAPSHRIQIPVTGQKIGEPPPASLDGSSSMASIRIPLKFAPFPVTQEGILKVRMAKGDSVYKLGALRVRKLAQGTTAASPPLPPPEN